MLKMISLKEKDMKISLKPLSILVLVFIFLLSACDSNNNSNAQDEPTGDECPCFALEDLMDFATQSTNIECSIEGIDLSFTFNSQDMPLIAVGCLLGGECDCQSPLLFPTRTMELTEQEFSLCFQTMLNAMLMFNDNEVKLESCDIN
jgi:hypothetical protein